MKTQIGWVILKYFLLLALFNFELPNTAIGQNETEHFLTIQGKDIWVRDLPVTGKVVMKLNTGDRCKIITLDELQVIRGQLNFWFLIEFNGKRGWVFGSQSDMAANLAATEYDQLWQNLISWLQKVKQSMSDAQFTESDMGLFLTREGDMENYSFNLNRWPMVEQKFAYIMVERIFNTTDGTTKNTRTFVIALNNSTWDFLTQFDGVPAYSVKLTNGKILVINDNLSFHSGVVMLGNEKDGFTQSFVETFTRSVVTNLLGMDLSTKKLQTIPLPKASAEAKDAAKSGGMVWNETSKMLTISSKEKPIRMKWDPIKMVFVKL